MGEAKTGKPAKCKQQCVSMDMEQLERIILFCQKNDRTISWVIRRGVDEFLNSYE